MTTLNISLPEAMTNFIQSQIAQGNYSTVSEYIQHLIAQEQRQITGAKIGDIVPDNYWQPLFDSLDMFSEDYMIERVQPVLEERENL